MRNREQQGRDLQEIMVYHNSDLMFIVLAISPVGKDNTVVSSRSSTGALSIEWTPVWPQFLSLPAPRLPCLCHHHSCCWFHSVDFPRSFHPYLGTGTGGENDACSHVSSAMADSLPLCILTHTTSHWCYWCASSDPHQFAFKTSRSTEGAISTSLHLVFTHLENKNSYIRMLFADFSSSFNTISSMKLVGKLKTLGLSTSPGLCAQPPPLHTGHPWLPSQTWKQLYP